MLIAYVFRNCTRWQLYKTFNSFSFCVLSTTSYRSPGLILLLCLLICANGRQKPFWIVFQNIPIQHKFHTSLIALSALSFLIMSPSAYYLLSLLPPPCSANQHTQSNHSCPMSYLPYCLSHNDWFQLSPATQVRSLYLPRPLFFSPRSWPPLPHHEIYTTYNIFLNRHQRHKPRRHVHS